MRDYPLSSPVHQLFDPVHQLFRKGLLGENIFDRFIAQERKVRVAGAFRMPVCDG